MRVASIYRNFDNEYFVVLDCACHFPMPEDLVHEADLPCPLHEPHRYLGPPSLAYDDD